MKTQLQEKQQQDRLTNVEVSVARLDTKTEVLATKLDIIANNHLQHLQADVTSIRKILWWLFSGIVGALISLVFILIQTFL